MKRTNHRITHISRCAGCSSAPNGCLNCDIAGKEDIEAAKVAGAKTIEERHQEDLAYGRMIWVRLPDGPMCHHMTMTEFEEAKKEFNRKAIEVQKETGADCVIYATKTYNEDGSIKVACLDIIPLDRVEYDRRTQSLGAKDEMVYTVYKREATQNT